MMPLTRHATPFAADIIVTPHTLPIIFAMPELTLWYAMFDAAPRFASARQRRY